MVKKHGFYRRLIFLSWYKVKSLNIFGLLPFNTPPPPPKKKKKKKTLDTFTDYEVCNIFLNTFSKELYTYTCNITKKLSF